VAESFRHDAGRAVAALARALRDLDRAEDAVQEAYLLALERWPADGIPVNPSAWVITTARNRAIDRLRRERRGAEKLEILGRLEAAVAVLPALPADDESATIPDDRLELLFACGHPSLNLEARVALTLRTLGGLTTEEIADAFLVPTATMAQRLVRAKRKIRAAGIPFEVPSLERLPERLDELCTIVYLIFNQGYAATSGGLVLRTDLCEEAIRLGRLLTHLLPDHAEALGLLALMMLHHARRAARTGADGEIVTLEDQDRTRWDGAEIGAALAVLAHASRLLHEGPYQLQAAIAAKHVLAKDSASTDWRNIARLYARLAAITPSPVVELNRAVAVAMSEGPAAGLAIVEDLEREGMLAEYHHLHAARADLLRRLGRNGDAATAYEQAVALAKNEADRRLLRERLAALRAQ
jgi:RNA polymerase sigma-70 factor, ECF subfamily